MKNKKNAYNSSLKYLAQMVVMIMCMSTMCLLVRVKKQCTNKQNAKKKISFIRQFTLCEKPTCNCQHTINKYTYSSLRCWVFVMTSNKMSSVFFPEGKRPARSSFSALTVMIYVTCFSCGFLPHSPPLGSPLAFIQGRRWNENQFLMCNKTKSCFFLLLRNDVSFNDIVAYN